MIVLKEKLYTSEETADVLGVTTRTLYRYVKNGEIEAETKTQSGTFRFTRDQIYKYLYPTKYTQILQLIRKKEHDTGTETYHYISNENLKESSSVDSQPSLVNETQPPVSQPEENIVSEFVNVTSDSSSTAPIEQESNVEPTYSENQQQTSEEESDSVDKASKDFDDALKNLENSLKSAPKPNVSSTEDTREDAIDSKSTNEAIQSKPETESIQDKTVNNSSSNHDSFNTPSINSQNREPIENVVKEGTSALKSEENAVKPLEKPENKDISADNREKDADIENTWNFYVNTNKGIIDLAKELNSKAVETGRRYAATMQGGLSLHHGIDEFKIVHFYVDPEDLNWWVQQLELSPADTNTANICLISAKDSSVLQNAYKLRGLYVVDDSQLIQDLMKHGEKELARTLI